MKKNFKKKANKFEKNKSDSQIYHGVDSRLLYLVQFPNITRQLILNNFFLNIQLVKNSKKKDGEVNKSNFFFNISLKIHGQFDLFSLYTKCN